MTTTTVRIALWAALLCAGTVHAEVNSSSQRRCDGARIRAWKNYLSCVGNAMAKDATATLADSIGVFAKCRHRYSTRWATFQSTASLAGSTCIGTRFTDNEDGTVADNLSRLVWEKKDTLGGIHDADNGYSWSNGPPYRENGTAFTHLLRTLNSGTGFGEANGWRLPTFAELQSIVLDFACEGRGTDPTCTCPSSPCIDHAFGPTRSGPGSSYWTATNYLPLSESHEAWFVFFDDGSVGINPKTAETYARAVRGGL